MKYSYKIHESDNGSMISRAQKFCMMLNEIIAIRKSLEK